MFGFLTIILLFIAILNLVRGKGPIRTVKRFNAASRLMRMHKYDTDHPSYVNALFYVLRVTAMTVMYFIVWGSWVLLGLYSDYYLYVIFMVIFGFVCGTVLNSFKRSEGSDDYKRMYMAYQIIYCMMLLLIFLNSQHLHL